MKPRHLLERLIVGTAPTALSHSLLLYLLRGLFVVGYRNVVSDAKAVVAGGEHR